MPVLNKPILVALVSIAVLAMAGCGGSMNNASFNVAGTVTAKGEPVPVGMVKFIPESPGGIVGFVKIVDGKFNTAQGNRTRGVEAGDYTIKVDGFDGVLPTDEAGSAAFPNGKPLFSQYLMKHRFESDTSLDIVVPSN